MDTYWVRVPGSVCSTSVPKAKSSGSRALAPSAPVLLGCPPPSRFDTVAKSLALKWRTLSPVIFLTLAVVIASYSAPVPLVNWPNQVCERPVTSAPRWAIRTFAKESRFTPTPMPGGSYV